METSASAKVRPSIVVRHIVLTLLMLVLLCGMRAVGPALSGAATARRAATIDCPAGSTGRGPATPSASRAGPAALPFPDEGGALTVFAGSSLTDAFEQIATDLEAANPNLSITFNFAGSQTLVAQLNQGARADVFAPADDAQMQAAIANGSVAAEPLAFARNRLTVVVPSGNPAELTTAADLAGDNVRLVLAQAEVPAGRYTRQSLCAMADDSATYGDDFLTGVASNIVSEEGDVREVLIKVRLGEADAAIVYVSDTVAAREEVELIPIPPAVNIDATYPIAAVEGGNGALAAAFIATVLSPTGQESLAAAGFEPIP